MKRLWAKITSFFHKVDAEEVRQQWLKKNGRIIEGIVIDLIQQGNSIVETDIKPGIPCTIFYRYTAFGVTYESVHGLTSQQLVHPENYRVGAQISVRYETRRPTNSLVE